MIIQRKKKEEERPIYESVQVVQVVGSSDHAGLAGGADEAVVVPMPALERDEPCSTDSCNAS